MPAQLSSLAQRLIRGVGFDLRRRHPYRDPAMLMAHKCQQLGVRTILDIGANVGQFGMELRDAGWTGKIVSFEPLSQAHAELSRRASGNWTVAPRCAIGSENAAITINVSANSASSSLLNVTDRSTTVAPGSAFSATETVLLRRLEDLVDDTWGKVALKIDTQGYEAEVLAGAGRVLDVTEVINVEISLSELYEGGPSGSQLFSILEGLGFRCVALTEGFSDPYRNEMLQVDGTFVRR